MIVKIIAFMILFCDLCIQLAIENDKTYIYQKENENQNYRIKRKLNVKPLLPEKGDMGDEETVFKKYEELRKGREKCERLNPCKNGGTCIGKSRGHLKFRCLCQLGYVGRYCTKRLPQCEKGPCKDKGDCVATPRGYMCLCKNGFRGKMCEYRTSLSLPSENEVRLVMKKDVFETVEIVLASIGTFIVVLVFILSVHCYFVNKKRTKIMEEMKIKIALGQRITSLPPGIIELSNRICREVLCCESPPVEEEILFENVEVTPLNFENASESEPLVHRKTSRQHSVPAVPESYSQPLVQHSASRRYSETTQIDPNVHRSPSRRVSQYTKHEYVVHPSRHKHLDAEHEKPVHRIASTHNSDIRYDVPPVQRNVSKRDSVWNKPLNVDISPSRVRRVREKSKSEKYIPQEKPQLRTYKSLPTHIDPDLHRPSWLSNRKVIEEPFGDLSNGSNRVQHVLSNSLPVLPANTSFSNMRNPDTQGFNDSREFTHQSRNKTNEDENVESNYEGDIPDDSELEVYAEKRSDFGSTSPNIRQSRVSQSKNFDDEKEVYEEHLNEPYSETRLPNIRNSRANFKKSFSSPVVRPSYQSVSSDRVPSRHLMKSPQSYHGESVPNQFDRESVSSLDVHNPMLDSRVSREGMERRKSSAHHRN